MSSRAMRILKMAQDMRRGVEECSSSEPSNSTICQSSYLEAHFPRKILSEDDERYVNKEESLESKVYQELQFSIVTHVDNDFDTENNNDNLNPEHHHPIQPTGEKAILVTTGNTSSNEEASSDNNSTRKLCRWNKQNSLLWKRNVERKKRSQGLPYKSTKGKIQVPKLPKPIDCTKCVYDCGKTISDEDRKLLCSQYWKLSFERQKDFIISNVLVNNPKERRPRKENAKPRENSKKYSFFVNGETIRVCQKFFCKTLCISNIPIITAFSGRGENGNFINIDRRGRNAPTNKTSKESIEAVMKHINSFPTVPSHYTRKSSKKKYLDTNLNITIMYRLYKEECQMSGLVPVSLITYRRIFCNNFNLSFFKPKKDQCVTCSVFEKASAVEKLALQDNYDLHIARKNDSMVAKSEDKERAINNPSFMSATFDLQSVLQIPTSSVSLLYYLRKLNLYNLTIYNAAPPNAGYCYFWSEVNGKRGSCEIGTCIAYYLHNLPSNITEVAFFSDTCGGQNRNVQISALLLHLVQKLPIQCIEHKFLESGHTFMEVDSMHSAIERRKKNVDIFSVHEWMNIFQQARKNKDPYSTKEFLFNEFLDLKYLSSETIKNRNIDENGEKVSWLKIKCFRYKKENPDVLEYRYDYKSDYKKIFVSQSKGTRKAQQPKTENLELRKLYFKHLPISTAKKNDLLSLCEKLIIPSELHSWYKSLPTGSVSNTTAEPAASDSDYDQDYSF